MRSTSRTTTFGSLAATRWSAGISWPHGRHQADRDHTGPAGQVQDPHVRCEPTGNAPSPAETACQDQEWDTEPERVRDEEHGPRQDTFVQEERQNRAEVRADARREPDAE